MMPKQAQYQHIVAIIDDIDEMLCAHEDLKAKLFCLRVDALSLKKEIIKDRLSNVDRITI